MNWRQLMKSEPYRHNGQNEQKQPETVSSVNIVDIVNRNENKTPSSQKAIGYGCAACGNRIYRAVEAWEMSELPASSPWGHEHTPVVHWKCEGCGIVFYWIGGTKEPQLIS